MNLTFLKLFVPKLILITPSLFSSLSGLILINFVLSSDKNDLGNMMLYINIIKNLKILLEI